MEGKIVEQKTNSDNDSQLYTSCESLEMKEECEAAENDDGAIDIADKAVGKETKSAFDSHNDSDLGGFYDSEEEEETGAICGLSAPLEMAKQLRDMFPNVSLAMSLEMATKHDTIESAIDQLLNWSVEGRVDKSLLLLKKNELFEKVNLTERRSFDPDDPLEQIFRLAKGHYLSVSGHRANEIDSIDYVENRIIMETFENKKDQLRYEGKDFKECLMFHGTSSDNIDNILQNNFRIDFAGKNGQSYGRGIYFSEKTAIPDRYSVGNKKLNKAILLCRVLLGREFLDDGPENIPEGFDSKSVNPDADNRATINIIKDVDQILPCFVLNLDPHNSHGLRPLAAMVKSIPSPTVTRNWIPKEIREASGQVPFGAQINALKTAKEKARERLVVSSQVSQSIPPRYSVDRVPLGPIVQGVPSSRAVLRGSKVPSLPPNQTGDGSSSASSLPLGATAKGTSSLPGSQAQSLPPPLWEVLRTEEDEMQLAIELSLASPNLDAMTEEAQMELAMNLSLVYVKGDNEEMEQLKQAMVLSITEKGDA